MKKHKKSRQALSLAGFLFYLTVLSGSFLSLDVRESVLAGEVDPTLLVDLDDLYDYLIADGNNVLNLSSLEM